jgi:hypothetical protein
MSAPSGEDAVRALLAERAPGYMMVKPRLAQPIVMPLRELGLIGVEVRDVANGIVHGFVYRPSADFRLADMLTLAARVIHAPLN